MADTKHSHAAGRDAVEGDGISYRGIVWFVAVLVMTTVLSQILMVGVFKYLEHDVASQDAPRSPLALPAGKMPPAPNLLYLSWGAPELSEPGNLKQFRDKEDAVLNSYAIDAASGTVRIPIDRAKALLLERGLPSRDTAAPPKSAAPTKPGK